LNYTYWTKKKNTSSKNYPDELFKKVVLSFSRK